MKSLKVVIFQSEQVPEINVAEETLQAYRAGSLTGLDAAELQTMIDRDPHLQKYYQSMDDALDDAMADCLLLASEDTSDLVDQSICLPYIPTHDQVCEMCDEVRSERISMLAHPSEDPDNGVQKISVDQNLPHEYDRFQNDYDKLAETVDNLV